MKEFKFWCQKVLPLVYDDSLSYYETLCKMSYKLNEVINNMNKIPDYIASLVSDEKLKEILSELLNTLEEQIASANEKKSETATNDRVVGELVWLDGELYRVIKQMNNGDKYVVNSNVEKITIENLLNEIHKTIANYVEVNEKNASKNITKGELFWFKNELCVAISDITEGNSYVLNGNYKIVTIEKLFKNINTEIDKVNNTLQEYDSRILTGENAYDNIYSCFINVLHPPTELEALDNGGTSDNSDKLNAIIQYIKTNNLSARIYFPCGNYLFNNTINVNTKHILFEGEERGGTKLILGNDTTLFYVGTSDNSVLVNFIKFNKLFFNTNVELTADSLYIKFENVSYCEITYCSMYNGVRYVVLNKAQGTKMYDVQMNNENSKDSVKGITINGRCVSSRFIRCTFNFINNTNCTAIECLDWCQDLYFERTETTGCDYVFNLDNVSSLAPGDIIIKNSIIDLVKGYFIFAQHLIAQELKKNIIIIDGAYITSNANSSKLIRLVSCNNVMISNLGFTNIEGNTSNDCISVNNCANVCINNCNFINFNRGVVIINCNSINVNGNCVKIDNTDGGASITATGSKYVCIHGNICGGRTNNIISVDAQTSFSLLNDNILYSATGYTGTIAFNATDSLNENNIVNHES
mgnify:FL=1